MKPDPMTPGDGARAYAHALPQRGDLARRSLVAVVVAAAALFAVLAQFGENGIVTWWRLRGETARLERQVARLERENAAIQVRLDDLEGDPEALETLARQEYGMRRPDEEVLTVLQPAAESARLP